ncbi:MAG TPA: hypothetical protein IAA11_00655 [Candidatus Blautia intestinigallinarum]|nr:hypothetical protein [Candidatus Blautia intestinigallinarum]
MNMIGLLGIIVSMILLILLVYKGMSNIYVAPVCALLVMITNGLPLLSTFKESYLGGIANWMSVGFAYAVLGALFGKIYEKTGAAQTVGRYLLNKLASDQDVSQSRMVLLGLIVMNAVSVLLTWTGVSGIVVMMATIPIAFSIARTANIPREFIPAILMNGGTIAAQAAPGAPSIGNLTASSILGTSATAALIPGLVNMAIVIVLGIIYMHKVIMRAIRAGRTFEEMDRDTVEQNTNRQYPNFFLALIPLAVIFLFFVIFSLDITICLTAGILIAVLLLTRYLPNKGVKEVFGMLNDGISSGCVVFFQLASLMGFATVLQESSAFTDIMDAVAGMNGNPLVVGTLAVVVFVLLTTSPPAAVQLGLPMVLPSVESGALAAGAIHRTAVIATTTFECMPYTGAVIISMASAGVSFKEGYKHVAVCNIAISIFSTAVTTLILVLFPGLA